MMFQTFPVADRSGQQAGQSNTCCAAHAQWGWVSSCWNIYCPPHPPPSKCCLDDSKYALLKSKCISRHQKVPSHKSLTPETLTMAFAPYADLFVAWRTWHPFSPKTSWSIDLSDHMFPLSFSQCDMSSGPENLDMFLHRTDVCRSLSVYLWMQLFLLLQSANTMLICTKLQLVGLWSLFILCTRKV